MENNKDITEWLLDNGINPLEVILSNGKEFFLSDILELHLKEQLSIKENNLLYCEFCQEDNPHRIYNHKNIKECEGCGLITKNNNNNKK